MILLDKKYYPFKNLLNTFAEYVVNFQELSIFEKSELLIAIKDLNISGELYRNLLNNVVEYKPEIPLNEDVLNQLNWYWFLSIYKLNLENRKSFVHHWLQKENRRKFGDDFIMISWVLILIVDNIDLCTKEEINKIKKLVNENSTKTKALSLKCLWPRSLEILGLRKLSNKIVESIIKEKEKNGSWHGDFSKSLRIGYHLLQSEAGQDYEFYDLLEFVKGKIERGFSSRPIIVAETIKFVNVINKNDESISKYISAQIEKIQEKSFDKIKKIIAKGELEEAINLINVNGLSNNKDKRETEVLQSRISRLSHEIRLGLISIDSARIEKNRISNSLIELIEKLN